MEGGDRRYMMSLWKGEIKYAHATIAVHLVKNVEEFRAWYINYTFESYQTHWWDHLHPLIEHNYIGYWLIINLKHTIIMISKYYLNYTELKMYILFSLNFVDDKFVLVNYNSQPISVCRILTSSSCFRNQCCSVCVGNETRTWTV